MPSFQNILVVVDVQDEHQRALHRAVKLAQRNGARLTVVTVVDQIPAFWQWILDQENGEEDTLLKTRQVQLQKIVDSVVDEAIQVSSKVVQGRPVIKIVNEVLQNDHDLVVKNALARVEPSPLFFGSVDLRLLRNCSCPVWLVKPTPSRPFERIVAAIDPFPETEAEKQLNRHILGIANSVAQADKSDLYVVSAWSALGESLLAGRVSSERLFEYVDEFSARGMEYLRSLVRDINIDLRPHRIRFDEGVPDRIICGQVEELKADLVVMGTLARTGVSGLFMGNTAEKVLRQIQCSVLTLKAEGFVSPVDTESA